MASSEGPSREMRRPGARAFWGAAAAGFVLSTAVVGGAAAGRSSATAQDLQAGGVVEGDLMAPRANEVIRGVEVTARLVGRGESRALEIEVHNRTARPRTVACEVRLDEATFAEVQPMARFVPPPQLVRLFTHPLQTSLGGGETRRTTVPLPETVVTDRAAGRLALSIGGS